MASLSGKFVFVVEDDVRNRVVYQVILARSGAMAVFDRLGKGTVDVLKRQKTIDLIILDLMAAQRGFRL